MVKAANRPNICYIFEKVMVRGLQKQFSQESDMQIHKYKYTNTDLEIDITCAIFFEKSKGCKNVKYDILDWMTRKRTFKGFQ